MKNSDIEDGLIFFSYCKYYNLMCILPTLVVNNLSRYFQLSNFNTKFLRINPNLFVLLFDHGMTGNKHTEIIESRILGIIEKYSSVSSNYLYTYFIYTIPCISVVRK
ncbi:hypothetical protein ES705_41852 [subsurface metagenome]